MKLYDNGSLFEAFAKVQSLHFKINETLNTFDIFYDHKVIGRLSFRFSKTFLKHFRAFKNDSLSLKTISTLLH